MELRSQFAFLRSALPLILASTLLVAAVAFGVSLVLPPTYESQVVLLVGQSGGSNSTGDFNALQVSQRLSQTYARLATSRQVANNVIEELELDTDYEELLKHVRAEAPVDSTLLTITVDDPDADLAARIANAFATDMIENPITGADRFTELQAIVEQELSVVRTQITATQAQIDGLQAEATLTPAQETRLLSLQSQAATLRQTLASLLGLTAGGPANELTIADPALAALTATSPRIPLNTILGAVLGLILGIAAAYTARRLDDTVRTPEDLATASGLPVVGTILQMPGDDRRPLFYRLATLLYPRSPAAEGFRHVRTSLEFANPDMPLRTLLVTSPMPGDGKTTFATNLAVVYAQAGKTVCLVDADLRKPAVHTVFQVPNGAGLSDVLRDATRSVASVAQRTDVDGLVIVPSGPLPANPAEAIASPRMREILSDLLERYEMVILDSPPLQAVTDAAILASIADGTLLVTSAGKTRRQAVSRAGETLARVGARVLGAGLNGVSQREGEEASMGYFGYYTVTAPVAEEPTAAPVTSSPARADTSARRAVRAKEPRTTDG